jgi:hypothetical protein
MPVTWELVVARHKTCTKCLLPATYPGVAFDKHGVCNHCLAHREEPLLGEELFFKKIHSRKGLEYDFVLGISGGKDSSYVAYLAKKKYKLRALAVCYDFPFLVDLARENIKNVCESLDLDLVIETSRNNLEYDLLRNHLLSVAPTGTTWGQCIFCHYGIDAVLYNIAKQKQIPFILSGITQNETWWNPGNRTKILMKRVSRLPPREWLGFLYYQVKAFRSLVDQRRQFRIPNNHCLNVYKRAKMPGDGPETVNVFDYIEWKAEEIEKTLIEETGWVKPEKAISWRYDCVLEPLLDYTYKKEFGISTVGLYLSELIRSGKMEREEALSIQERCEEEEGLRRSVEDVLDYLRIPSAVREKFFSDMQGK